MKLSCWMIITVLSAGSGAQAADTPNRTSPVDANAACMDRNVDSSSGNCVTKDEGKPRRAYPPKQAPAGSAPASAPSPSSPNVRKSAAGS